MWETRKEQMLLEKGCWHLTQGRIATNPQLLKNTKQYLQNIVKQSTKQGMPVDVQIIFAKVFH